MPVREHEWNKRRCWGRSNAQQLAMSENFGITNLSHVGAYDVPGPTIRQLALIGIPAKALRIFRIGRQVRVRRNDTPRWT